jgi:peptidyl-prolyl cis-trans isomerase B (cyclophilin B)
VVGIFGDANPVAASRFAALAVGIQGLGYKRTEINAVEYCEDGGVDNPLFIGNNGVRAFVIPGSSTPVDGLPVRM